MSIQKFFKEALQWKLAGGAQSAGVATYATDPLTGGVIGLIAPDGKQPPSQSSTLRTTTQPWKIAFWGDSRYNTSATTTPDVAGSALSMVNVRTPTWLMAFMGDAEYSQTYAISGDQAINWSSASRANGKTFANLNVSDVEVVFIQYGVNDAITGGKTAAQITGYLQNLIAEIFKSGKLVVFESIYPVNTPVASYAAVQAVLDTTNANMQAWLAYFPLQALYVDTATTFKAGGSYANAAYIDATDGLHPTRLGAYTSAKLLASAIRSLMPKRISAFNGPLSPAPNLINLTSPQPITTQFNSVITGSATVVQSQGQDTNGFYYEWDITTTALAGGYSRVECQMSANLQSVSPPYVSLQGNEVLQGSAHIVADDGAGNAPSAYEIAMRQRFYTGAVYSDWGILNAGPQVTDANFNEKLDIRPMTGKLANATASVVANPSYGGGLVLSVFISTQQLGYSRVRVYNPQLRRVGYTSTPAAVTPPASTANYTNNTNAPQQVFFAGGAVTAIAINSVATGLTSGVFILNPGDTLTPTYTVAPTTFTVQQLMTQPSMRGLI